MIITQCHTLEDKIQLNTYRYYNNYNINYLENIINNDSFFNCFGMMSQGTIIYPH